MPPLRSRRSAAIRASEAITDTSDSMSRPRRGARESDPVAMATVSRESPSSPSNPQSLRLTVKLPTSKLRAATRMASSTRAAQSRNAFAGGEILEGRRARNIKKSYVIESESDDYDSYGVEEDDADEDAVDPGTEADEMDVDDDEDAPGEEDADGDIDMDIPPPPPVIKVSRAEKTGKQIITAKPSSKGDGKTVEQKEGAAVSDDDELSDLESEIEEEDAIEEVEEEGVDAEGDEEEVEVGEDDEGEDDEEEEEEEEDDEDDLDSDDETPGGGSGASTPDLTKLTKRQRARLEEGGDEELMALPDEVQVKKHLTAEEHAMRRAEMARRRKNLSEKRNEEEKMETINKLLKKQAPKLSSRRRDVILAASDSTPEEAPRPNPVYVRWINNKEGSKIAVPQEWLESPVGSTFTNGAVKSGKLIEEVQ